MILYLSGTGNTRWAAQQIAFATSDELICMTAPGVQTALRPLNPGERVGFCLPVHGWRPPRVVRRFISELTLPTAGHYVYALCTAGDTLGETMDILRQDLLRRGIRLDATYSLLMPNTYVGLPLMDVDKPEVERRKLADAERRIKEYTRDIIDCKPGGAPLDIGRWPKINSRLLGAASVGYLNSDKPFRVDSAQCVKCGICANVCPLRNIVGGLGQEPRWRHQDSCMSCFACYHHCPHRAISYGRQTRGKGQYFYNHPKKQVSR